MNTDENRILEQKEAKVAKSFAAVFTLQPSAPPIHLPRLLHCLVAAAAIVVTSNSAAGQEPAAAQPLAAPPIRIWDLAVAGGVFMIPIAGMSLLAVTMAIERLFALRKQRVLPRGLVKNLRELEQQPGALDAGAALAVCRQFPSAAANVVKAMLARGGRSLAEIESAAAQASQREADRLYANVRWINLAASLATMLGLIGTIQGMIMAFHRLTVTEVIADRTTMLAAGIYTALVTTFAGLAVAIPSLLMSHFFEGRILGLFHQIDEMTFQLLPRLAQPYETQDALSRQNGASSVQNRPELKT